MDDRTALTAFAGLAQETRLQILRLLVRAGPEGLPAGEIGAALGASSSRLSFHLTQLEQARLVTSRREGRFVIYAAAYPVLSDLVTFLMRDCCADRPEICAPLSEARHD
ncbi:regulatory protein, ArsR [Cereibacter sphaeroides WS8N]|uniref:ArsR/SmtB family transcription factor n=1 Tax=Cereibacter sphaeroides TaxID=1063 RepID=UPI00020DF645|nr:metalloregulator ArsR/SmtB family transcription factor [Cereibacter sphaeroides]EGJ21187.1 regulatory protein, ArsR [Cereibacter sphaeroides WS8N]MWP36648.1 metalloregulator ArsR/SmtB family transcription factor [Cereibacter sphaeroides]SNS21205.1 transcriptional regulator, ArsR family [[Luteovulum] sphaeroides subsp. megalophilum]